uniref:GST C-terminal domain-containing protein n=1 Tax=Panagrellus redivivus TaxID=6233 RepID=A0A7E4VV99_PANRE
MMYATGKDLKKAEAHCGYFIGKGLDVLEKELTKTAGKYAFGDELSLVDVLIPAQVYNAHRFKVDMSKYPTINRVNSALVEIPEVVQADAWHQIDTPEGERKN